MSATRYYRSKIGRLPWKMRNELNERIRDGATGPVLLAWMNSSAEWSSVRSATGLEDINPQNLTDWRNTGYKDWLDEQDRTERLAKMASLSQQIISQTGGDPTSVGCRIAAGRLLDALESADRDSVDELAKSFATLRSVENDARRVDLAADKQRLDEQRLSLERQKFQRQTVQAFVKQWYKDEAIRAVMENKTLDNDAQTEALGRLMFADLWDQKK